jgi:GntR family transcriptional regulator, carbon starvation induced regulator
MTERGFMPSSDNGLITGEPQRTGATASTVETVYDALQADIISGKRKPGEFLRIDRISRLYGVGPTPLRETLQRLTGEGMVIAHGGRGFQVAALSVEEFVDLNTARTAIELAALRLSIQHGTEDWEGRVVAAGYILQKWDKQIQGAADGLIDRWENANSEFHAALISGCPSVWLLRTLDGLRTKCERYRRATMIGAGYPFHRDVAREHAEMLEAVLARDVDRSCKVLTAHYMGTVHAFRALADQITTTPDDPEE